jgi:hypothetical protein
MLQFQENPFFAFVSLATSLFRFRSDCPFFQIVSFHYPTALLGTWAPADDS